MVLAKCLAQKRPSKWKLSSLSSEELPPTSNVILGKLCNFSVPQFPNLLEGADDNNNPHLLGWCEK